VNGALLRFVLWRHRVAYVACWVVPVLIAAAVGLIYPTYAKEREALTRLLKIADKFFGDDAIDLLSPVGFLLIPFQHPLTLLMLAMAASVAPLGLPAGDRGRGALDLLLATPLSRRALARTMLAAILAAGATFGWAPYLGVAIAAHLAGYAPEIPFGTCAIIALNAGALVVALGAAALFCSATADDGASATTRFVGFVVVTLAIDVLSRFWKTGRWLRWTSLLGYYHPHDLVADRVSAWLTIGVLLAFAAVVYAGAEWILATRRRA
jgi:ABC-2 type transport system permease protein